MDYQNPPKVMFVWYQHVAQNCARIPFNSNV